MSTHEHDIQTAFLKDLLRDRKVVWVFLVNGIKLTGQLLSYDKYVLALQSPNGLQTVFKSAVSTVCESHVIEGNQTSARPATSRGRSSLRGPQR